MIKDDNEILEEICKEYILEQMYNYKVMQMNMEDEAKEYFNQIDYDEKERELN